MQVASIQKRHSPKGMKRVTALTSTAMFVAPLLALLAIWTIVVPLFDVNPRIFPSVGMVGTAAIESIRDGTLIWHIGASLMRVGLGTIIGVVLAVPLGIAMGVSPGVSAFLTPLFRFFSVLAGIARIPIATLWFGYGAIIFVIVNAVFFVVAYNTLLGVSTIPRSLRNAAASLGASRWAILTDVLLPGALPNIVTGIRMDPAIAREFARVTFTSDSRADLPLVTRPSLILQCAEDAIAPLEAGAYVHGAIPGSTLAVLKATGHCPHLSAPSEVVSAIRAFA